MRTCPRCNARYADDVTLCAVDGEALPDPDIEDGSVVGEYRIEGRLGAGAFGSVYRAVHPVIGKRVAIKVLNRQFSANPEMVSRFVAEARAVNQIGHKNIIDIFAFGQLGDGRQYYVMELLRGVTLDRYLGDRSRLMMQEAVPILRGIGRALDAAHKTGIAHRDLKPANILVADDDGRAFPKLLDFGIAKLMSSADGLSHRTRTGTPMGTPFYMSPEQCRGRDVDHRTDIYSFGVMTYELLTGVRPFVGEDFLEIITKQVGAEPTPPSHLCEDLPVGCDDVIAWMMKKDPAARPPTVGAAVDALEQVAAAGGIAVHTGVTRLTAPERDRLASTMGRASSPAIAVDKTVLGTGTQPPASKTAPGQPTTSPPAAQTLNNSMVAAEVQATAPPRRRTGLIAGVAVVAVAGIAAVVASKGGGGTGNAETVRPAPTPPAPAPAPAPTPPTTPTPVAAPTPTATGIVVTVSGTDGADVFDASHKKLGTIPVKLELPRGDIAIELRAEKTGFQPATTAVTPTADTTVTLALQPAKAAPAPSTVKPTIPAAPTPPTPPPPPTTKKSGLPDF